MKRLIQRLLIKWFCWLQRREAVMQCKDLVQRGLLVIGRYTYGTPRIWMYEGSERKVVIGSFCSIAPEVEMIAGGIHPDNWVSTYPFRINWKMKGGFADGTPTSRGDILIGSDVWLGTGAMVLSGVTIGHGAIVAARSVVTRDVPPYAIVAGSPATVLRFRFEPDIVQKLLEIAWWDWNDARIRQFVPLLSSTQIGEFVKLAASSEGRMSGPDTVIRIEDPWQSAL